jgi:hypothetical protein
LLGCSVSNSLAFTDRSKLPFSLASQINGYSCLSS